MLEPFAPSWSIGQLESPTCSFVDASGIFLLLQSCTFASRIAQDANNGKDQLQPIGKKKFYQQKNK